VVVSIGWKSSDQTEQVRVRKTNESEPSEDASL